MRDWIRKRLDGYEGRHEKRDEEFAAIWNGAVDAMSDRRTLWRFLGILATANSVIWLSVIIFPRNVSNAWSKVTDVNDKFGALVVAIIFGIGLWLTYSILRLRIPDVEDQTLDAEIFGSVTYHARANKRFFVWLFSTVGGVVNVLGIVIVELALSGN